MIREPIALTLNSAGGGTVQTSRPLWGEVSEVRYNGGTAFIGTGTVTITRKDDGGTILAGAPGSGTWNFEPRQDSHTPTLGTVTYDGTNIVNDRIPLDGYMQVVVLGGGSAATGVIQVYID